MSNHNPNVPRDKPNTLFSESSSDESEPELTNEQIDQMTDREIMAMNLRNSITIKMKIKKLENKTIPKIQKSVERIKTNQINQEEKIELLEEKEKESSKKNEVIVEKLKNLEEEVRQNTHSINTNRRNLEDASENIDARNSNDETTIKELKDKITALEKHNSEQILLKQFQNDFNVKINEIRADMIQMSERFSLPSLPPIPTFQPGGTQEPTSIQEEIRTATNLNFSKALQIPPSPSNPVEATNKVPKPVKIQTVRDVMREAASNIGIGNVSDANIRRFSKRQDAHRFPNEEVFKGEKFASARSLFVEFYLTQIMRFHPNEIRFKNIRMCREPEKGILWIQSDPVFIKSMNLKAASLKNKEINLVMFTPGEAFERIKTLRKLCEAIRSPDKENIKTQIRPGRDDFDVYVKNLANPTNQRYVKIKNKDIDPNNELPDFELKEMSHSELQEYHNATMRAIRDAQNEEEENSTNPATEETQQDSADDHFTVVAEKKKRKKPEERTPEKSENRPEKVRREITPESVKTTVSSIHTIIGYKAHNDTNESIESD